MRNKKTFIILLAVVAILFVNEEAMAQGCAMCRVAPESNLKGGGDVAKNLNTGILFLMAIPYILLVSATWYFFRKQINNKLVQLGWKKQA